jgi:hypothetical protein
VSRNSINVTINNHTAILSRLKSKTYDKLRSYFSYFLFSAEHYNHIVKARPHFRQCRICHLYPSQHKHEVSHDYVPVWDGRINFPKKGQVPTGLFWSLWKEIEAKEHME